jgi:diguanylate cyclase (GGDEF)-like protein/PAS domain S-box-containing protein
MNKLFFPAIAMMNRLNYTRKFMVLGLIYLAAIIVLAYGLYTCLNQVSRTSQRQLEGIELIKPISGIVQFMQQHRGLSAGVLGGNTAMRSQLDVKEIETVKAFDAAERRLSDGWGLGKDWAQLKADWIGLQNDWPHWTADESFTAHTGLIGRMMEFEVRVADDYALTFDPDIDAFYLIDTTINKLPLALEQLGQIRAFGTGILTNGQISEHQKAEIIALVAELRHALKFLTLNLEKTGRFNPEIQGALLAANKDIVDSAHRIVDLVQSDIVSGHFVTMPEDFFKMVTEAIDQGYSQMDQVLLPTAEVLITARIQRAKNELYVSIGIACLLLLVVHYFLTGIYYAMIGSIHALARSARVFAGGDMSERINLATCDELRQVGDSFNEMADGFNALLAARLEDKANEARLRSIIDASPVPMVLNDDQQNITFLNSAFSQTFGYTLEDIPTLDAWWVKAGPDSEYRACMAATWHTMLETVLHSDSQFNPVELEIRCHSGSAKTVLANAAGIKQSLGNVQLVVLYDITERKKAEQKLLEREARYRAVTYSANDAIITTDNAGNIAGWNRGAEAIFGYSETEISGQPLTRLMPHRYRDQHIAGMSRVLSGGVSHISDKTVELAGLRKDGSEFPLELSLAKWEAPEGWFVTGIIRDITERKQAEADLRIAAIAFETQDAMIITDANQVILKVNQAFTRITGYSAEEAIGQTPALLKSGYQNAQFYQAMWESLAREGYWQSEIWNRRKTGDVYPERITITVVTNVEGDAVNYVATFDDISQHKKAEETIHDLIFYDTLTKLPNRRLLVERLKHSIEVERREGKQLALMMLDLDRFKVINDSLGHLAGDELLQQVATRIATRLRKVDIVARLRKVDLLARLGGDEFILLLEDITHMEDAARVAEQIIAILSKPFYLSQGDEVCITASIGISLYPQHGDNPETLISYADAALNKAKAEGRSCFAYYSEDLTLAARERIALEARLRKAIELHELRVFYQPQVDIATGQIIGAEALVRWQDPIEGLVGPAGFIPLAEETGLILEIGAWVLRETCRQGKHWLDAGLPAITLSVNVSAHQFRRSDVCALVTTVLTETGFPAEQLELEMTESGLMERQDKVMALLNELRALGVRFAIDDFGTGYSSLAYLKHFPLDSLKIDKGFIDDIPHLQDDMEIAATIIAMGHMLGFKVLAEGVETAEQLAFLQDKGCDAYQGYLKSKPVPAEEFVELLRAQ